jgi:hypothetical protein
MESYLMNLHEKCPDCCETIMYGYKCDCGWPYECNLCGKEFEDKNEHTEHILRCKNV